MNKTVLLVMTLIWIVAVLIFLSVASHANSFDGNWTVSVYTSRGDCPSMQTDVSVQNGTVYRQGRAGGSVSANGSVRLSGIDQYGSGSGGGRLSGNSGRGNWRAVGSSGRSCTGGWQAWRR